jgi:hypothetical protein
LVFDHYRGRTSEDFLTIWKYLENLHSKWPAYTIEIYPSMADVRVLLIGNGGREHALAWKLSQSSRVEAIFVVPGNGGTATCPKVTNVSSVSAEDFPGLVQFAKSKGVNLVVPGPEAPLDAIERGCSLGGQ